MLEDAVYIEFNCPQCIEYYRLSPDTAGRKAACERCGVKFYVPAQSWGKAALAEMPVTNMTIQLPANPRHERRRMPKPKCPHCASEFDADSGLDGVNVGCNGCGEIFLLMLRDDESFIGCFCDGTIPDFTDNAAVDRQVVEEQKKVKRVVAQQTLRLKAVDAGQ
jgi:DNA-directed RNA polymerase subunit RPC12/RpoP